jgi:hypothetical protein
MEALDTILEKIEADALTLMEESTDHDVLEAVVVEGTPMVMGYKMRAIIPQPERMVRIATYLVALAAAMENRRGTRRAKM